MFTEVCKYLVKYDIPQYFLEYMITSCVLFIKLLYILYCLLNDKKYAQKVWSKDLVYKKPFGYIYVNLTKVFFFF